MKVKMNTCMIICSIIVILIILFFVNRWFQNRWIHQQEKEAQQDSETFCGAGTCSFHS